MINPLFASFASVMPKIHALVEKGLLGEPAIPTTGNAARIVGEVIEVTFGARGEVMLSIAMPGGGDGIWNLTDVAFPGA